MIIDWDIAKEFIQIIAALSGVIVGSAITVCINHAGRLRLDFVSCNITFDKMRNGEFVLSEIKDAEQIKISFSFYIHNSKSYQLSYRDIIFIIKDGNNYHELIVYPSNHRGLFNNPIDVLNIPAKTCEKHEMECYIWVEKDQMNLINLFINRINDLSYLLRMNNHKGRSKTYEIPMRSLTFSKIDN